MADKFQRHNKSRTTPMIHTIFSDNGDNQQNPPIVLVLGKCKVQVSLLNLSSIGHSRTKKQSEY